MRGAPAPGPPALERAARRPDRRQRGPGALPPAVDHSHPKRGVL